MHLTDVINYGRECLQAEAEAIRHAAQRLDNSFARALDCIAACKGRVVVSGMGKSGHIARKISATLSSTGSPSFFLHPAEALHGDFGLLRKGDVLLAIAFGGETYEVNAVCRYAAHLQLPIIAITGRLVSTLSSLADIVLDGSVQEEACPLGLAPTSSAITALALGDALAAALMKQRGFTARQFARLHPGGNLGRRFQEVADFQQQATTVSPRADFFAVLHGVSSHNHGIVAVVDATNNLLGAITDGDVRRALTQHRDKAFAMPAADLMTRQPQTVTPDVLVAEAVQRMEQHRITALFLVPATSSKLLGVVRLHELMAGGEV